MVTVNASLSFNTTVPTGTTSVNIFETFPNVSRRRHTIYSLRVAAISNTGQSYFTDPVSIGKTMYTVIHIRNLII